MPDAPVMVRHTHLETFIVATLMAMKMPRSPAEITAGLMVRTDLRGVDSHGIGMLPRLRAVVARGLSGARRRATGRAGRRRHGAARRGQVSRPLPRHARDEKGDREGQGLRDRHRHRAELEPFRRRRQLLDDGARARLDRPQHDQHAQSPGRADPSAARPCSAPTRSRSRRQRATTLRSFWTWRPPPSRWASS